MSHTDIARLSQPPPPRHDLDRHVVTAVLVAHDGARWLPETLKALLAQTRPVQRLVAVDTGSRDRGPAVLAEIMGAGNLVTLPRATSYGEAVAQGLRHPAATMAVPDPAAETGGDGATLRPRGERVEWIWLLHDDSAPAADALEKLLATAEDTPSAAILGPKLRDWLDRRVLIEVGVTIDRAGRRETGLDRREFDQGQHDGVREVLAVSSAGMLVRRDVWAKLGGFDPELGLFRDDVDFGWRARTAGHRVFVATDAVVYHAEASARHRRRIGVAAVSPTWLDRRNALYVLFVNLPTMAMFAALVRNTLGVLLRALLLLVTKHQAAAREELGALGSLLRAPGLIRRARKVRAGNRRHAYHSIKLFQPRGLGLRRLSEMSTGLMAGSADSRHYGVDLGDPDEELYVPEAGPLRRFLTHPGVLVTLILLAVTVLAERGDLVGGGWLSGGALAPVWGGASDLWDQYLSGWHAVGLGSEVAAPPYVGILAVLSTMLLGKPWLTVTVLLLGCVPLAGITAYIAARRIVPETRGGLVSETRGDEPEEGEGDRVDPGARSRARLVRAWAAGTYALLPVATGAVSSGRLGTAVVIVLVPLIGLAVARMLTAPPQAAHRAAWATGLLLTVAMAFVPVTWLIGLILGGLAWGTFASAVPGLGRRLSIALATPALLLLLPWTVSMIVHPSRFLLEAGLHRPDLVAMGRSDWSLLALNPGGPGTPAVWATAGLVLVGLAGLLLPVRRQAVLVGWLLGLFGLLVAILESTITVSKGADSAPAWPGVPLAFAAAGIVLAGATMVRRAVDILTGQDGGRSARRIGAAAIVVLAVSAPVLAAASWVVTGARGPLERAEQEAVPGFVGAAQSTTKGRMLVLRRQRDGRVVYTVLRGRPPMLGESETPTSDQARRRLDTLVAALVAGRAGDDGEALARVGIQHVLMPSPVDERLVEILDGAPDLTRLSRTEAFTLWRLVPPAGRLMLVDGNTVTPLPAGRVEARVDIPAGSSSRLLVLAEPADGGWHASLNGEDVPSRTVDGWSQGYEIPASGGTFELSRGMWLRHIWLWAQLLALAAVVVLALPGGRAGEGAGEGAGQGAEEAPRRRRAGADIEGAGSGQGAGVEEEEERLPVQERPPQRRERGRRAAAGRRARGRRAIRGSRTARASGAREGRRQEAESETASETASTDPRRGAGVGHSDDARQDLPHRQDPRESRIGWADGPFQATGTDWPDHPRRGTGTDEADVPRGQRGIGWSEDAR